MEAHGGAIEVDEHEPDVRVLANIADGGHHTIAAILRKCQRVLIQDMNKPGCSCPEA